MSSNAHSTAPQAVAMSVESRDVEPVLRPSLHPESRSAVRERCEALARQVFARGLAAAIPSQPPDAPPQPRPHQVEAVARLLEGVYWDCTAPAPVNYLLQHSTGSGKSFTLAALAVALCGWRDGAGGAVGRVLLLSDRLQLEEQLGGAVEGFWRGNGGPPGGLLRAATTAQLAAFLAPAPQQQQQHHHPEGEGDPCWAPTPPGCPSPPPGASSPQQPPASSPPSPPCHPEEEQEEAPSCRPRCRPLVVLCTVQKLTALWR
ncbi:hypothetical protein Agub_g6165, partial [Astrephomene gubernaculifera]